MSDSTKKTMVNSGDYTRRWDSLLRLEDKVDGEGVLLASAGSTLELEPGESAVVMIPADFDDVWLKEAKVGAAQRKKQDAATTVAAEAAKEG